MKQIILLLIILLLTGCQTKAVLFCTATSNNDQHLDHYSLTATFNDNQLTTMTLAADSAYHDDNAVQAAYRFIKQGYEEITALDNSIMTNVYYLKQQLYFTVKIDIAQVNNDGLKYVQNLFQLTDGYPTRQDFMKYTKNNNYICD